MSYYEIVQKVLPKDEPFIQIPPNASNIEVKVTESNRWYYISNQWYLYADSSTLFQ